nr:unnamed protein product [Callosobruchus analis]
MGAHNSLKTLLVNDIPDPYTMKCICHSLALFASYASEKLPDDAEKLVRSIYSYMHHSYKRQSSFQEFQIFYNIKPHKLLHPSQTRWLSLISAVSRVLEQYDALQNYFRIEAFDQASGADEINSMLNNPLYPRILSACKFLLSCFLKPDYLKNTKLENIQYHNQQNFLPIDDIYLGPKVAAEFTKHNISQTVKNNIKTKCLFFYIEAVSQIYKRFPFNSREIKILELLTVMSPSNIHKTESIVPLGLMFPNMVNDINALDREIRELKFANFDFSLDEIEFWKEVCNFKKGDNSLVFPELSRFINILFTLPHSSACVERLFSATNINKTKLRNSLGSETLSGILHSKRLISFNNTSCFNFPITEDLINKHNNTMYR